MSKKLEVYTDGSYKDGVGSWAYIIIQEDHILKEKFGTKRYTDNLEMEYQAIIEALHEIDLDTEVTLYSDSRIVLDNILIEMKDWKKQNWKKKNAKEIPHVEKLRQIDELIQNRKISWKWVKAHSGNFYNDYCDKLCIRARSSI